jgi:predicted ATP-dependent serine protease
MTASNPFAKTVPVDVAGKKKGNWDMGVESKGLRRLGSIDVPTRFTERMSFGIDVIDALINGDGLVAGQKITVAAPRGSGKTTLLMGIMQKFVESNKGTKAAYISNEECVEQLAFTATRINCPDVLADNMTDIDEIAELMKELDLIVLDSTAGLTCKHIQGEHQKDAYALATLCKAAHDHECSIVFIQHFTKDGKEKGNSGWGHAVDTCIAIHKMDIEDYGENVRLIEVDKNRFGSGAEIMLRLTREGFDFSNPVEQKTGGNDGNTGGGVYVQAKIRDTRAIMNLIKSKNSNGGAKLQDFGDLSIDMGRVERLLKDLVNGGKIVATGGGKGQSKDTKRWHLGDTDDEDFDGEGE